MTSAALWKNYISIIDCDRIQERYSVGHRITYTFTSWKYVNCWT